MHRFTLCLLLAGASFGFLQAEEGASQQSAVADKTEIGQWPRWRGPRADGISHETGWSTDWPEGGPRQLWTKSVGMGFSCTSVAGGKLYTVGHAGEIDTLYCLNAESGDEIWKVSYSAPIAKDADEGGPASTPTVDGDRVYVLSKKGRFACLDAASGKEIWKVELEELLEMPMSGWGYSCSPLVVGEQIIVEAGCTAALDKHTGKLVWKTEKYRHGYGSPMTFQHNGEPRIAVLNNDFLLVLRARDGQEIDKYRWETPSSTAATTPIVHGNTIFISTGYKRGCALFELKDDKLEQRYENKNMSNHINSCVLWKEHLYGFDGNTHVRRLVKLTCIEQATSKVKWRQGDLGVGSLIVADGKLIVLSEEGELIVAEASPEAFKVLARAKVLDGTCWTLPVLANGRIYCRNSAGKLVALDVRK